MSGALAAWTVPAQVRTLTGDDHAAFAALGARSTLSSLQSDDTRRSLLSRGLVFGAFVEGTLVGCSAMMFDTPRSYCLRDETVAILPVPNAYLCSTFVLPSARGCGVGTALYKRRLEVLREIERPIVGVEILGTGTPFAVDEHARPGLRFHLAAGFSIGGYSAEPDRGPMLIRKVGVLCRR